LFVRPNPSSSTDSYIYVDNTYLFVEDNINLEENTNNPSTEASIYLREGAQIIQGSGSTQNAGDGSISIYQTVTETSNYHYNFWHSPVGNQDLGGSGNQNAGVSRFNEVVDITDSNLALTTSGSNGDNSPLRISTRWIYTRSSSPDNEQEANYNFVGPTDGISVGQGFTMKGVSDGTNTTISYQYDFRGRPNNGTVNVPVLSGNQWTLSGNPYPSAIDLKLFFADNTANGLTGILFWDEPKNSEYSHQYTDKSGGYGVWLPGTSGDPEGLYTAPAFKNYTADGGFIGGNLGSGSVYNRRFSPVGQGFVLRTNAAGTITTTNSHRVFDNTITNVRSNDNGTNEGGKSTDPSEISEFVTPKIRLNIVMNDEFARQLLLSFHEESTDGYDVGLDGHHPMDSGGAEAYYLIEENGEMGPFVIQTLPFGNNKQIPVGFTLNTETRIRIKTLEIINFNREAFFWDSLNDSYRKLSTNPNELYDSSFMLPAGDYHDRFYIVFKNRRQLLEDSDGTKAIVNAKAAVDFYQNNPIKQLEVSNPDRYDIKTAAIYDMTGKLVASRKNIGTLSNFNIATSNLSDGVYLVKLITVKNIEIDYKTIIINK
jgi:hypothetical protein